MVLGPECRTSCGGLWLPVPPCAAGLDPLYIKISDSGELDLEAWCLDAWMLEGLEWIGGGDGGDVGGIGRSSHTLELQELGRYTIVMFVDHA